MDAHPLKSSSILKQGLFNISYDDIYNFGSSPLHNQEIQDKDSDTESPKYVVPHFTLCSA